MKRKWLILLLLTPVLLFAIYWVSVYLSLKNPMEEMHYAQRSANDWVRPMPYPPYAESIGSSYDREGIGAYEGYVYSKNIIKNNEDLIVRMSEHLSAGIDYVYYYYLEKDVYIGMSMTYDSTKKILVQDELYLEKGETSYKGSDLLTELAKYGKDINWLRAQSKKVVEQYILGTWFKRGSSRYSLKNLGDMKIKYNDLLKEK